MWSQNYTPLGGLLPSALVAALPVVVLLALLGVWHVRAHVAALAGLACAATIAILIYKMPAALVIRAAGFRAAFGLFPIGWIVLNAIFIYELSVVTGQFEVLKKHIAGLAEDRRIQALLVAFCFGAFIEGCAGFGAPVAITGAMLIGLGFKPLEAAKLALIGNTAPVAFGSLGIPLTTLNSVTGLDLHALSAMVGRQLPVFSLIVPFWLVAAQVGWRGMLQVWPACFVCGASFAVTQFAVSNFHGPWLVDLASAIASMISLVALLRVWKPPTSMFGVRCSMFDVSTDPVPNIELRTPNIEHRSGGTLRPWLPWLMLSLFVATWSIAPVKARLIKLALWKHAVPLLHDAVIRVPPVSDETPNAMREKIGRGFDALHSCNRARCAASRPRSSSARDGVSCAPAAASSASNACASLRACSSRFPCNRAVSARATSPVHRHREHEAPLDGVVFRARVHVLENAPRHAVRQSPTGPFNIP